LGELGALIEFSVHNDMHMRWSALPRDPQTNEPIPAGRRVGDIDSRWDNPRNNYLGDFYSSHVNPIFWRLHGWIDDRIDDWFRAHEHRHPGAVRRRQIDGVDWFEAGHWVEPVTPWVWGGSAGNHSHGHGGRRNRDTDIATLETLIHILYPPRALAISNDDTLRGQFTFDENF
jgi:hypothetical protein